MQGHEDCKIFIKSITDGKHCRVLGKSWFGGILEGFILLVNGFFNPHTQNKFNPKDLIAE